MLKLSAVIAVRKGAVEHGERVLTDMHHLTQKSGLFSGLSRVYRPKNEDGETLPAERTQVQLRGAEILRNVAEAVGRQLDVVATNDAGNSGASADVKLPDGTILLREVPVTTLLALEKKLDGIGVFLKKLPTLDPAERWEFDSASDTWRSDVSETTRTKKVPRNHIKSEATEKHPAQVEVYLEDIGVGTWSLTKYSGAFRQVDLNDLRARLSVLQDAVKIARENANSTEVPDVKIGDEVFKYLGFIA